MNQWELEANTCYRRQARENACEQGTIGFAFTSDWLGKWRALFFNQSKSAVERIPIECSKNKTKATFLLWSVTKHANNAMNQLEFEANTC